MSDIQELGENGWRVLGQKNRKNTYTVHRDVYEDPEYPEDNETEWRCTCQAYYHHNVCNHLERVWKYLGLDKDPITFKHGNKNLGTLSWNVFGEEWHVTAADDLHMTAEKPFQWFSNQVCVVAETDGGITPEEAEQELQLHRQKCIDTWQKQIRTLEKKIKKWA